MTKKVLKTIAVLMLTIFISNCENDNSGLDAITEESLDLKQTSPAEESSTKVATNNCVYWSIESYEGPVWFDFRAGRKEYPYVNTIINTTETSCDGAWIATGGFKIIESTKRKARVKRINQNKGTIQFINGSLDGYLMEFDDFVPNGSSVPCPNESNTSMYKSDIRYMNAGSYVPEYTYSWKVVNYGRTTHHSNKTVIRMPLGRSTVTLSVSLNGCITQTNTQSYFIGNSNPGGPRPPRDRN
ncbi:hypothetical protein [Aquimarina macrocephali]|uniref:hypothetical protein n=1 Tax=Aquimarina macrocephali TaxID=666563 RepID=UPI0004647C9A|nr:hypothetical protein [Aquimarina macrocephali]